MPKASKGRGQMQGTKMKITVGIPTLAQINCVDNSGAKILNVFGVYETRGVLNRYPMASIGDIVYVSVRKGKPDMRKKKSKALVIRQRKPWRRKDGTTLFCEDNAAILLTQKLEVKKSAISGPVTKEAAELFPKIASYASSVL